MNANQKESFNKNKSNKTLSTSKTKKTFFSRINSKFAKLKNFLIWLLNIISSFFRKCSIITHFIIIIIPFSILFILLIFFIQLNFFDNLFRFNYFKGVKEEFYDRYIVEIDDLHSELDTFIIKESYIDVENILFFDIYFRELSSLGLLDNSNENIFPDIHYNSNSLYSEIDEYYKSINLNSIYSIPNDQANQYIDKRDDSLKELAKIYYYMLPSINYGIYFTGVNIYQTFLIAYEYNENNNVENEELYFSFPKSNQIVEQYNHNFLINHGYLNPKISKNQYNYSKLINNTYFNENYFQRQDFDFRRLSKFDDEFHTLMNFGHLNKENNGNISKSLIITSQLNINRKNKHYVISIIFYLEQNQNILEDYSIDYSTFIIKNDSKINFKYSDNESYIISQEDYMEYSLSKIDREFFHYGLYDKNYNFFKNGVSFDSFNLNYLYNLINYYSTVDEYNHDLIYYSYMFLYVKMFQNIENSIYEKKGEEIIINVFSEEEKVKKICGEINLTNYIEYIKTNVEIDCWEMQNLLYSNDDYKNKTLLDSFASFPLCICLPLYCLNNYKTLKNDKFKFSENNIVSKINLPNKCQPKFNYYVDENSPKFSESSTIKSKWLFKLFNSEDQIPERQYIKIEKLNLTQMKDYYLIIFSDIKTNFRSLFSLFYNTKQKIEITILVAGILILLFTITFFIIYKKLKKISLIIFEFSEKYEKFVYHSRCNDIELLNYENNNYNFHIENQINEHNDNEIMPLHQNNNSLISDLYNDDNCLIEDLFSIYCKYYNICKKTLEKLYSKKDHQTKYQMKLKMMTKKNELFKLLCMFSIYAPFFRLNLSLDYKMYKYSKMIQKYNKYINQVGSLEKNQTKLTKNILYELLSTENISDYGLVMNLNFKYISNINADNKENSIQNTLFMNVFDKKRRKNKKEDNKESEENEENENNININNIFFTSKDGDEKQNVKLIMKKRNELMEVFKNKFEGDDFLNFNKIESTFNFFLVNSYYKYMKQISLEEI